jgi:hypothetical protein
MGELGSQKVSILLFLINRTLYYRKAAEQIWTKQWLEGIVDKHGNRVCSGIGMSDNTYRKHLNELIESDFVHAYRVVDDSGAEFVGRLYEINFTKLVASTVTQGSKMPLLATPKRLKDAENGSERGSNAGDTPLPKLGIQNSINKRLTKVNLAADAPRSGKAVAGTEEIVTTPRLHGPKNRRRAADDQSPAYEDPPEPTARELVAALKAKSDRARADRLASAASKQPWQLTKQELQAMIDKGMKLYHPSAPRMVVTYREYGYMRKYLKQSAPKDFSAFLDWTLRMWSNIAVQHRRAVTRNQDRMLKDEQLIGASPSFSSLAYKLPYFIKAHSNFVAELNGAEREDEADRRVARLERELENTRQTVRVLSRRPKTSTPEPTRQRDVVPERRGRVISDTSVEFDPKDDPVFGEWQNETPEQYRRRTQRVG